MPKIDLEAIVPKVGSGYPPPLDRPIGAAQFRRLAPAGGVVDFEISHVTLAEGEWSSQRHWHEGEDEGSTGTRTVRRIEFVTIGFAFPT
jgi:uncharacterized cupin superfamily protein